MGNENEKVLGSASGMSANWRQSNGRPSCVKRTNYASGAARVVERVRWPCKSYGVSGGRMKGTAHSTATQAEPKPSSLRDQSEMRLGHRRGGDGQLTRVTGYVPFGVERMRMSWR